MVTGGVIGERKGGRRKPVLTRWLVPFFLAAGFQADALSPICFLPSRLIGHFILPQQIVYFFGASALHSLPMQDFCFQYLLGKFK
jgi:hypothetical protein